MFSRPYRRASLLAAIVAALVLGGELAGAFDPLERWLLDLRFAWFNQDLPVSDDIVFVEFDDESVDALAPEIGGWPWPRGTVVAALMLDYIMIGDPAILLFDELYATYSPKAPGTDIPEEDWLMLEASMAYPNVSHGVLFENRGLAEPIEMFEAAIANFAIDVRGTPRAPRSYELPSYDFPSFDAYRAPYEPLRDYASLLHAKVDPNPRRGRTQRVALLVRYDSSFYPTLPIRAVDALLQPRSYVLEDHGLVLQLGDGESKLIPLLSNGDYLLNRYPPTAEFETHTASAIIASSRSYFAGREETPVPAESFQNKIVVLGSEGSLDELTAVSNILNEQHLSRSPRWLTFLLVVVIAAAVVTATVFLRRASHAVGPLVILAVIAAGALTFRGVGVVLDMATLLSASALSYGGAVVYRRVARTKADGRLAGPSGSARELTLLSCRLQGITELGELLPAERVVTVLDQYLGTMMASVPASKSTLGTVSGDAALGAALIGDGQTDDSLASVSEDRLEAVRTGLRIAEEVSALGEAEVPSLRLGIGVHTGTVIVGEIGATGQTIVVGRNVDLGRRVCELTTHYRVPILVTGETYEGIGDEFVFAFLDTVMIAGRSVELHAPLAEQSAPSGVDTAEERRREREAAAAFASARGAYHRRDFQVARNEFAAIETDERNPLAGPASVFRARCERFIKTPPPDGWSGIWRTG